MQDKEVMELSENRAIVSLPSYAFAVNIVCKIVDDDGNTLLSVSKSMNINDVNDAFRRCGDGYFYEDGSPHAELASPNDSLSLVYIPENAVYARFTCKCLNPCDAAEDDPVVTTEERTLSVVDIRRAFEYADNDYIDEDDMFTITEKGMKFLENYLEELDT